MAGYPTALSLAKEVGVSRQTIVTMEVGLTYPTLQVAERVAKALGISVEQVAQECRKLAAKRQKGVENVVTD